MLGWRNPDLSPQGIVKKGAELLLATVRSVSIRTTFAATRFAATVTKGQQNET
jgi:hypothetical protein